MRLLERFNPLFALAIDIHSCPVTMENKEGLQDAVYKAVAFEQNASVSTGISLEDMDIARAIVYFFVDEILMDEDVTGFSLNANEAQPKVNLAWYLNSLQNTFYNTEKGGELFFVYFEQILDKILALASQNADNKDLLPPTLALNEKFLRVSQMLAGSEEIAQDLAFVSATETLQVFAQCLLYGFRGKYYDVTYHTFLQELRQTSYAYLQMQGYTLNKGEHVDLFSQDSHNIPLNQQLRRKTKLGYFFYIACPPLFCIIWYFYCAQTVSQILL